jgi:flavodoxin I
MKALIVYDSMYGNTEKIAKSIGGAITGDVKVLHIGEVNPYELESIGFLIVGSPTQGFRPTKSVQTFIESIPGDTLKGIDTAAFDTRIPTSEVGTGLRLLMKMGGYAAGRIAEALKKKGGNLAVPPEGFFVKDKEGPLKEGEVERAASWAKEIVESKK